MNGERLFSDSGQMTVAKDRAVRAAHMVCVVDARASKRTPLMPATLIAHSASSCSSSPSSCW